MLLYSPTETTAWQVIKNHIPVCLCFSEEEAECRYAEYEADEIREILIPISDQS